MTGNYIGNNPNGLDIVLSDSYETNNSQLIASTKCVNNVYNNLKELIDSKGGGLPLGHIYLWPFSIPPDGSIQLNGSTYNRELYSDLWALIREKNWYKPESEWQQIASANGGYCPWYSDGDGSTTFRTPKFAPYQKLALASGDAGKYYEAGLPNIIGSFINVQNTDKNVATGAFDDNSLVFGYSVGGGINVYSGGITFYASRSNPIYGNSTTVQPESNDWIVCVVAFGTATNVGSVDVANVMSAVSQVQSDISNIESSFNTNVVRAGMPNWDAAISVPIKNNYTYTAPSDGFLLFSVQGTTNGASLRVSINGVDYNFTSPGTNNVDYEHFCFTILPMIKGTICKIVQMSRIVAHFLPAYGV